jgi:hypothetical protein
MTKTYQSGRDLALAKQAINLPTNEGTGDWPSCWERGVQSPEISIPPFEAVRKGGGY